MELKVCLKSMKEVVTIAAIACNEPGFSVGEEKNCRDTAMKPTKLILARKIKKSSTFSRRGCFFGCHSSVGGRLFSRVCKSTAAMNDITLCCAQAKKINN